jgi:hypothetical protein
MADRYSDILKGARLKKALDNYIKYLSGEVDRQPNIGNGTPRPAGTTLYVSPFATKLATKQYAQVSGSEAFWTANKTKFGTHTKDSIDGGSGETALKLKGYRAARVSYKTNIGQKGTPETSNATKMKYLSYGGTYSSAPFGQKTTETENAAYTDIAGNFTVNATAKVYWNREKY